MELDATKIGVFGINLRSDFDQTWLTFWRKEDCFELDLFAMIGDEDPVQERIMHIVTVDNLTSLLICDSSLDVVDIIVLEDVLSCTEVESLELLL